MSFRIIVPAIMSEAVRNPESELARGGRPPRAMVSPMTTASPIIMQLGSRTRETYALSRAVGLGRTLVMMG